MLAPRRLVLVLVPAVVAATVASDFVVGGFWQKHPMAAGTVSGLVLLLIGIAVVDAVLEHQNAKRWRTAARVGFKALARSVEEALDDLTFAITGAPPPYAAYSAPWSDGCSAQLMALRVDDVSATSIARVLRDPARCGALEEALVALRLRHRERLSRWLPAFISVGALADVAEELARFNELLGAVQGPVSDARRAEDRDAAADALGVRCRERLLDVVRAGIALQTQLMHDADAEWFTPEDRHLRLLDEHPGAAHAAAAAAGD